MEIILLLLIFFIFFPLLKVIYAVWKSVRVFKQAYDQQSDNFGKQQSGNRKQPQQKTRDSRKKRIIDFFKKSSEDADFVEIKGDRNPTSADDTTTSGSSKPHISDAQYEDIK